MVQVLRILALVALVAVSATAETVERQQSDSAVVSRSAHQRMLVAEAGSGSHAGGATVGSVPAANAPVLAQWTAAKALLEKAFAGEPTLLASLKEFETKVQTALQKEITLDEAKAIIGTWLASLEKDPAFAKVSAQLAPIKAVLGTAGSSTTKTGSGSGTGGATVGKTTAPTTNSTSNSTAATPAPTSSASTVAAFVVPAVVAIAGVVASL